MKKDLIQVHTEFSPQTAKLDANWQLKNQEAL
jgi:hypothetical protein